MNFDNLTSKIVPGLSSFRELRAGQCTCVDKTALIYKIAKDRTPKFLSRPRRFGKSTWSPPWKNSSGTVPERMTATSLISKDWL